MFEVTLIGFALLILGTFLIIVCAWIQVKTHNAIVRDAAEIVFNLAGLAGAGGWLVFWTGIIRSGVEELGLDLAQMPVSMLILGMAGIMTVISYKPLGDQLRGWVARNTQLPTSGPEM